MKKTIICTLVLIISTMSLVKAQSGLRGLNVGIGVPVECYDLKAAGMTLHIGGDFAYTVNDKCAVGFYVSGGGGFLGSFKPYNEYDKFYSMLKLSAGLMMELGDLNNKPFLFGVSPCIGLGYVDMDLVLPIELRFGRVFANNWYVMGEIFYGVSLAKETRCFEPVIRVGYNFGPKKSRK